jgi:membrane protein implicated in regulation of membrane protease activity
MPWGMWIVLGFGLLAGEALSPGGFFLFFFGLSAVMIGGLVAAGIVDGDATQWLLFSVLSVASLLLLRPRLVGRFREARGGNTGMPDLVGDVAILTGDLEPGAVGKAELRGTSWNVRSLASARVPSGSRCIVERVEGLTLWIAPPGGAV